jgi:hypothetical protein
VVLCPVAPGVVSRVVVVPHDHPGMHPMGLLEVRVSLVEGVASPVEIRAELCLQGSYTLLQQTLHKQR